MKHSITFTVILLVAICGCEQQREKQTKGAFVATHVIDINDPIEISIDDLIVDVDTIRLEVTDESLMKDILSIHIMDSQIYILTNNFTMVQIFDLKGNYVAHINDKGQGPKEYISISSMEIDLSNERLILSDNLSKRIFIYDTNGKQTDVIQLDFNPLLIVPYRDEYIHIGSAFKNYHKDPKMDDYYIHFLDSRGQFVSSTMEKGLKNNIDISATFQVEALTNGEILYQPLFSHLVFKINEEGILPYYELNNRSTYKTMTKDIIENFEYKFGKKPNMLKEKEEQGYLLTRGDLFDMKEYAIFLFRGYDKYQCLFFNKKTSKSYFIDPEKIKGNEDVIHFFLRDFCAVSDDRIYSAPSEYRTRRVRGHMNNEIVKAFIENSEPDSNPLLISFKIQFPE